MRFIKTSLKVLLVTIAAGAIIIYLFMLQPSFGKLPSGDRKKRIENSPQFRNGSFQNLEKTKLLADDALICTDSGHNTGLAAQHLMIREGQAFAVSGTLASMGCGVPYAIAGAGSRSVVIPSPFHELLVSSPAAEFKLEHRLNFALITLTPWQQ